MSKEAMNLALEALNNSVDLVIEDAYNAEKLYGNYPTRQGKVGGLKVLAENHKEAIKALEEALAKQEGQSNFCPQCEALARELKAAKQEQGEPVAHMNQNGVIHEAGYDWAPTNILRPLVFGDTTPQQRKPLTDEQIANIVIEMNGNEPPALFWKDLTRAIEAAHGIKEKNT